MGQQCVLLYKALLVIDSMQLMKGEGYLQLPSRDRMHEREHRCRHISIDFWIFKVYTLFRVCIKLGFIRGSKIDIANAVPSDRFIGVKLNVNQ